MTKSERHKTLCDTLNTIYIQKNNDYGDSFRQTFLEGGYAMARIRPTDKLNRFKSLTRANASQKVTDESLTDTLLDLANYALMTVLEIREAQGIDKAYENTTKPPHQPVVVDSVNRSAYQPVTARSVKAGDYDA